jgi:hypothetical protein
MGGTEPPCWGLDPWDLTSWQRQCRPTKRDGNLGTPKPALAYGGHTSTFDLTGRNGQTNPLKVAGDMRSWDVQPSRTTERWEAGEDRAGHARQPLLGVGILSDTMAPLPAKLSTTLSLLLENSAHYSSPLYRGSLEPSPSEGQPPPSRSAEVCHSTLPGPGCQTLPARCRFRPPQPWGGEPRTRSRSPSSRIQGIRKSADPQSLNSARTGAWSEGVSPSFFFL